jgi:hypothetical protein
MHVIYIFQDLDYWILMFAIPASATKALGTVSIEEEQSL